MSEPFKDLSHFIIICVVLAWPVGWLLSAFLKRRWGRGYDGQVEASSEEILKELKSAYAPSRRTVIRTQTEYLPFLFERIRENIEEGLEDSLVFALLERIELQKPGLERSAVLTVVSGGKRGELHLRWTCDACGRIELHVLGDPGIIRTLREYKKTIPKAQTRFVGSGG